MRIEDCSVDPSQIREDFWAHRGVSVNFKISDWKKIEIRSQEPDKFVRERKITSGATTILGCRGMSCDDQKRKKLDDSRPNRKMLAFSAAFGQNFGSEQITKSVCDITKSPRIASDGIDSEFHQHDNSFQIIVFKIHDEPVLLPRPPPTRYAPKARLRGCADRG